MVRPFLFKPQWMNGLSERLLVSHYENNYGGALRRLNAIRARLATLDWASTPTFEINGLKREELIAAVSVILHEIYFDSLGGYGDWAGRAGRPARPCARTRFRQRLGVAHRVYRMAKALAGGSGWAILAWSERLGQLVNHWAADHAHGLPGAIPILALDMYEHAYHLDFGAESGCLCRSGDGEPELGPDRCAVSPGNRRRSGRRRAFPPLRRAGARRGAYFSRGAEGRARA
jgi:Fe-Mn family superoxide dismutase